MTSDLDWARFHEAFGEDPGVLPDGEVAGSVEHDWDALFTMLHRSGWKVTTSDGYLPLPPNRRGLAEFEIFAVCPVDGVRVNFFPGPHGVFFDVDLRELVNQAAVDGLAHVMRKLGTMLRRDVVLRDEGSSGAPIIRYATATDLFSIS
ncbi:hypothetical protein ACIQH5_12370 [Paenarthrobacter sp. NPDC091711]|uniref:hypothetical protein n=1 Tax=Paenarthrobacter sp. NPDC091711 TaxID=3364385 RepID=UPI00381F822B